MYKFWIIGLVLALLEGNFAKLIGLKSQRRTFRDESVGDGDNETAHKSSAMLCDSTSGQLGLCRG